MEGRVAAIPTMEATVMPTIPSLSRLMEISREDSTIQTNTMHRVGNTKEVMEVMLEVPHQHKASQEVSPTEPLLHSNNNRIPLSSATRASSSRRTST